MIPKATDGYYHPRNEAEVCDLVKHAAVRRLTVRVRGSAHSVQAAILSGDFAAPPLHNQDINILLDRMIAISFDYQRQQVTVEAGCHLGKDPADPTHTSTVENSLFYQIDRKGWAFPDMGGIIHQTVGGFLATGSSGGSLRHTVERQIMALRVVDGNGEVHEYRRSDDLDDPFYALGVSMGLLGIITAVTFQCVDRYDIAGTETTSTLQNCAIDLFGGGGAGRPGLETFFGSVDYSRILWFPQPGVDKVVVWQANRTSASASPPSYKPYREFPALLGSELPAQVLASLLFRLFDALNPPEPSSPVGQAFKSLLKPLYPPVVNAFLASAVLGPQHFSDTWWRGVPMDDRVNYNLLPTRFTELWLPLARTAEAMADLREHYRQGGYTATTTYACEFYATLSNNFWLSPAYQQDSFRIDPFWFAPNRGNPDVVYFRQYWDLLRKYNYRLHWGKSLLGDVDYLKAQYPRWEDFMRLRTQMDPQQVFVTDYWRRHLDIARESSA